MHNYTTFIYKNQLKMFFINSGQAILKFFKVYYFRYTYYLNKSKWTDILIFFPDILMYYSKINIERYYEFNLYFVKVKYIKSANF